MPRIGVTMAWAAATERGPARVTLNEAYVRAVEAAGAVPVMIPPGGNEAAVGAYLDVIDGLVLTGGGDVDPTRYGETAHASVAGVSGERDDMEFAVVRGALERGMPVLAICRGMQVLNVALGGSLVQHIPEAFPGSQHQQTPAEARSALTHDVRLELDSLAARVMGVTGLRTNSMHHQAMGRPGDGIVATGWAADGVIEACELRGRAVLGVQWHPEELAGEREARALFAWIAAEAGARGSE